MHFLMPHIFSSMKEFKEWFSDPVASMVEAGSSSRDYQNEALIARLHTVLRPFLLRRLKRDVAKQLPPKSEVVITCRLSKRQRQLYEDFMAASSTKATLASGSYLGMMNVLMQLRKTCNHPDLFQPRPIISPFDTVVPITFNVPSLATTAIRAEEPIAFSPDEYGLILSTPTVEEMFVNGRDLPDVKTGGPQVQATTATGAATASAATATGVAAPTTAAPTPALQKAVRGPKYPRSPPQWPRPTVRPAHSLIEELTPPKGAIESLGAGSNASPIVPFGTLVPSTPGISAVNVGAGSGGENSYSSIWDPILAAHETNRVQRNARNLRLNTVRCLARPQFGAQLLALLSRWHRAGSHARVWLVHELFGDSNPPGTAKFDPLLPRDPLAAGNAVRQAVKLPWQRMKEAEGMLKQFVCIIPKARAPQIEMHCAHPDPSERVRQISWSRTVESELKREVRTGLFHEVAIRQKLNFPDKRLMQWDCGKLQMLDKLLRQLKSGGHRVLLFTQMTKMVGVCVVCCVCVCVLCLFVASLDSMH